MKIKICGIFQEETLKELNGLGVWPDYLGFVFANSRRQITTKELEKWQKYIPAETLMVGVFVNPSLNQVEEAAKFIDIVQLHGEESPELCNEIKKRFNKMVWKAIPVLDGQKSLANLEYHSSIDAYLFDTAGKLRGGNGVKFNWELYKNIWEKLDKPIFIAGGIRQEDVRILMEYQIEGIDLSSGVEIDGFKSPKKIIDIIQEVKKC